MAFVQHLFRLLYNVFFLVVCLNFRFGIHSIVKTYTLIFRCSSLFSWTVCCCKQNFLISRWYWFAQPRTASLTRWNDLLLSRFAYILFYLWDRALISMQSTSELLSSCLLSIDKSHCFQKKNFTVITSKIIYFINFSNFFQLRYFYNKKFKNKQILINNFILI